MENKIRERIEQADEEMAKLEQTINAAQEQLNLWRVRYHALQLLRVELGQLLPKQEEVSGSLEES